MNRITSKRERTYPHTIANSVTHLGAAGVVYDLDQSDVNCKGLVKKSTDSVLQTRLLRGKNQLCKMPY